MVNILKELYYKLYIPPKLDVSAQSIEDGHGACGGDHGVWGCATASEHGAWVPSYTARHTLEGWNLVNCQNGLLHND